MFRHGNIYKVLTIIMACALLIFIIALKFLSLIDDKSNNRRNTTENADDIQNMSIGKNNLSISIKNLEFERESMVTTCGNIVNVANALIINGNDAKPGDWPWHVAIYILEDSTFKYRCGGSLVGRNHVITVAHCVTAAGTSKQIAEDEFILYFGRTMLDTIESSMQVRRIETISIHPEYNHNYFHNDIAVVKFAQSADYSDFVRPVCLWEKKFDEILVGKLGTVIGWGFGVNHEVENVLQETQMPIVDTTSCVSSKPEFFEKFTSNKTFCAGYKNGTSVCNGDSGGGMFFRNENVWYLRGIVSVSLALQRKYCDPHNYVVFADLAAHIDFVQSNIIRP